jgi:zinc transport system substrate-binding protein
MKPSDMELLSNADILVMNGLGVEGFLLDAIEASGNSKLIIIDLSQSIFPDNEFDNHSEGGKDPHIWLSLDNAVTMVDYLASRLGEKYPENADFYRINANTYNSNLMKLKDEISDDFSGVQPARFFVFHNAYDYYLEENNLENYKAGVVEEFPGDEPGASYLQELTDMIAENNVKIVFTEPQFSPKLIRTLEEELDIYTFEIDPIGNEISAAGYQNNMRKITKNFVQGFAVVD